MTKDESMICKSIGITLMYVHHLFYSLDYFNADEIKYGMLFSNADSLINFAQLCKVCVTIFVLITGYGTAKVYQKNKIENLRQANEHAFCSYVKLLLSFQIVFILSQICAVLFTGNKMFINTYGNNIGTAIYYIFIDFLGLSSGIGTPTFNDSWWYVSFALIVILLFPLLNEVVKKMGIFSVVLLMLLGRYVETGYVFIMYLLPVVVGALLAYSNFFEHWKKFVKKNYINRIGLCCAVIVCGLWLCWLRMNVYAGIDIINTALAILVCCFVVTVINEIPILKDIACFIGKYSMNMYFVHSFVKYYFFKEFTYSFKYPVVILAVLIADTLLIALVIEKFKQIIGLNGVIVKINKNIKNICIIGDKNNEKNMEKDKQ